MIPRITKVSCGQVNQSAAMSSQNGEANIKNTLIRDLTIIFLSVIVAIVLARSGILKAWLTSTQEWRFLGSLVAGLFFVSVFTAAPAVVGLVAIAQSNSVLEVAAFGGIGAMLGDLLIFRFIKDSLAQNISYLIKRSKQERLGQIFQLELFKWLVPFVGALVVASPLPDELGLVMMGLSKMKTVLFILITFLLNSLGILIIGLIAKGSW